MRIAATLPYFSTRVGQAEYYLYREMVKLGDEVTIITSDRPYPSALQDRSERFPLGVSEVDGIDVVRVRLRLQVGDWAFFPGQYAREVARASPDIVHAHEMRYYASRVAAGTSKALGVPLVLTQHAYHVPVTWYYRLPFRLWMATLGRSVVPAASRFIALAEAQKRYLLRWGAAPERVDTIPSGVDAELFKPMASSERHFGERVILFVGSYSDRKMGLLVPIVEAICGEGTQWRFVFVGKGEMKADIRALGERYPDNVMDAGFVPRDRIPGVMNAADIFVQPSREEIFGLSALEAQSCGLPVVATAEGGLQTIVEQDRTGIVTPKEPAAIAAALKRLMDDAGLRERMGRLARERAVEHYTWERVAERTRAVFELAMQSEGVKTPGTV